MKIARGGGIFVVGALAPLAAAWPWLWPVGSAMPALLAGAGALLLTLFLWFFRDPERTPDLGLEEAVALAPSDGRVLKVRKGPQGHRIEIFLSLFDVHVTRLPLAGRIVSLRREGGGLRPAFHRRAGSNTRVVTQIETAGGLMMVSQITGLLTRRIVPYLEPGQRPGRGARLGLIRFGSRVEVTLPPGYRITVGPGDRLTAGRTPVALPEWVPAAAEGDA